MSGSLRVQGLTVSRGSVVVLDGVAMTVGAGDRVGVVGPNGVGKTTLLRSLAGEIQPERGTVARHPASASVAHVPQEPDAMPGERLVDYLGRRTGVTAARSRMDTAAEALAAGKRGSDEEYATALEIWLALGGADLAERAAVVCAQLGLAADVLGRGDTEPAELARSGGTELSGGESARLRLATALLVRADVVLLDEPTNDLDLPGLERLERFVLGFPGGIVLVSHDREFCARTVDRVLEIDEFTHTVSEYSGGWQSYLDERAAAHNRAEADYAAYAEKRGELIERARRQREWARTGALRAARPDREPDKNIRHGKVERAQRTGARAVTTEKALERMEEVEEPREAWQLQLTISSAGRGSEIVFSLRNAVIERGGVRLGPVDLTVTAGDRIRIVGPNGSGKSTLIAAMLGRLPLVSGSVHIGSNVKVGEMEQTRLALRGDVPLLDRLQELAGLSPVDCRTLLAKFRLGADAVLRPVDSLSPGERTRAGLALFQARGSTCLILDEPTNHLDLQAIEQLESALSTYDGTVLLVTHDRRLAANVEITREIDVESL